MWTELKFPLFPDRLALYCPALELWSLTASEMYLQEVCSSDRILMSVDVSQVLSVASTRCREFEREHMQLRQQVM